MSSDGDLTMRVAQATAAAIAVVALAVGVWQVRSVLILRGGRRDLLHSRGHLVLRLGARLR